MFRSVMRPNYSRGRRIGKPLAQRCVGPPQKCSSPDHAAQKLLAEYRQTAAAGLRKVTLVCDEVSALCPLTKQPDQHLTSIPTHRSLEA